MPRDEVLDWVRELIDKPEHRDRKIIFMTHAFLHERTAKRIEKNSYKITPGNTGAEIWQKLIEPASNIRLVVCGHECHPTMNYFETVGWRVDKNAAGKSVAQMMFNAQTADGQWHGNGGDGWLRILEFLPDGKTVSVRTFSPMFALSPVTCDKAWRTADYDQFTFDME